MTYRRHLLPMAALAVVAGLGLWWWGASPVARWAGHGGSAGPALPAVAGFGAAWLLMVVATMVPTTVPLLASFGRVSAARPLRWALTAAVIVGLLGVWAMAGLVAAVVDRGVHAIVAGPEHHPGSATGGVRAWVMLTLVLLLAGAYQLSDLAARCLRGCRSPVSFLHRHWTGGPDAVRQSLAVGADYGRSCLGCCAPLMAVMLVVGMGNLAWMYLLALVAAAQKAAPWGPRLARGVGVTLVLSGVAVAAGHLGG